MEINGTLRNARRLSKSEDLRGPCLQGQVYGDTKGRFRDGALIVTSTIVSEEADVFKTRFSVYRVESWADAPKAANDNSFQERVMVWAEQCFATSIVREKEQRNHRFLEEALELVQSLGSTAEDAHMLVDFVFGRPVGEPRQEMGGVAVTLALLAEVNGLNVVADGEQELARILRPEIMAKVRAKQLAKPASSPLPGLAV